MYISPHAHLHTREIGECTEMNCENSTVQSILLRITFASERSGVECARDEIYAHCEITITRI